MAALKRRRASPLMRGAALTELAIMLPVFLLTVYASLYLCDLGVAKLHGQEIARYTAWAVATRGLSDFASFNHASRFTAAQSAAVFEVNTLYSDLDAQSARASGATLAARHVATTIQDIGDASTPPLTASPAASLGTWTSVLSKLAIAGANNLEHNMGALGFDVQGLITAQTHMQILPLARQADADVAAALASEADVASSTPAAGGTELYDTDGTLLHTTLLADSWRVPVGYSAHPMIGNTQDRQLANVVARVDRDIFLALVPGAIGTVVASVTARLPDAVNALVGWPLERPETHVIARPYTEQRPTRPAYNGTPAPGQLDIFRETGGAAEYGASEQVRVFESGALYDDPYAPQAGPFVKALNRRGPNFMGCTRVASPGCATSP